MVIVINPKANDVIVSFEDAPNNGEAVVVNGDTNNDDYDGNVSTIYRHYIYCNVDGFVNCYF